MITPTHLRKYHAGWNTQRYRMTFPDAPLRYFSQETCQLMSETRVVKWRDLDFRDTMIRSLCGRVFSPEACENISEGHKGLRHSSESREKIRKANVGKTMSEASCQKISEKASQRKPCCKGYKSVKTGQKVLYRSSWELCYFFTLEYCEGVVYYTSEPVAIDYVNKEGKLRKYRPDVLAYYRDGRVELIEIKAAWAVTRGNNPLKFAAARLYAEKYGWFFYIITEDDFDFDRKLIRSLAAQIENDVEERKVQRLGSETTQVNKELTSAGHHHEYDG